MTSPTATRIGSVLGQLTWITRVARVSGTIWTPFLALLLGFSLVHCDSGPTEPPGSAIAPIALNVQLDDETNLGDARDLVVTFDVASDESAIQEYRIVLVTEEDAPTFNVPAAIALAADRSVVQNPAGGSQRVLLPQGALDAGGQAVVEGSSYVAFVISVGGPAIESSLSFPSNGMTLAQTTIKVTYLGNAGVLIEDDTHRVVIDGLTGSLSGWIPLPTTATSALVAGSAPFDGVDAVMTSHNHGDHFSPTAVSNFMANNPQATFVGPPQVRAGLSLGSRAIDVSPARGERETVMVGGLRIDVLHLRHFSQFGNAFTDVENFGFVVHLGGKKILHAGDVLYSTSNFGPFDLVAEGIDLIVLPTFNTLLSEANAAVIDTLVAPGATIALHFQQPLVDDESRRAARLFGATTFKRALEFVRY